MFQVLIASELQWLFQSCPVPIPGLLPPGSPCWLSSQPATADSVLAVDVLDEHEISSRTCVRLVRCSPGNDPGRA